MFFLLRCAFWLGLTFAMMDWPDGPAPDPAALAQAVTSAASQEIATRCAANPQACLDGARKVEALRKSANDLQKPAKRASVTRAAN